MEPLMLTATPVLQKYTETLNNRYANRLKLSLERATATLEAMGKLRKEGVHGVPEPEEYHLDCGFSIEVEHATEREKMMRNQWGKIHRAVGKLVVWEKSPLVSVEPNKRGKRKQLIKVTLTPAQEKYHGVVKFTFVKQLTEKDRCQVRIVRSSRMEVVCRSSND